MYPQTYTVESMIHKDGYFPEGTKLRIEWVADEYTQKQAVTSDGKRVPPKKGFKEKKVVWKGYVSGKFTQQFDPGMYVWKAHKHTDFQQDNFSETGAFLVGMTEDEWRRVTRMRPKNQHSIMTSSGSSVFTCQISGCDKKSMSRIAAVLHEAEHQGVDLLKNPELKKSVDLTIEKQQEPKRGPGRPRKVSA